MKKWSRGLACLLLAAALGLPLTVPASAAKYADLPESHWAHDDMLHAVRLGIVNGVGNNRIAPSAPLSWGQFLTMLARAFYYSDYAAAVYSGLTWDQAGLQAAKTSGTLLENDFLSVNSANLNRTITRQEVAVLIHRALPEEALKKDAYSGWWWNTPPSAETSLSDWNTLDSSYQEAVSDLVRLRIVQGKADGTFGGQDPLQRSDGSVLMVRAISALDNTLSGQEQAITVQFVDPNGTALGEAKSVTVRVGTSTRSLMDAYTPAGYTYDYNDGQSFNISSVQNKYTLTVRPMTELERQEAEFWAKVERGEAKEEDYYRQDFWLKAQGENIRKYSLLFGNEETRRFANKEEAQAHMVTITVPVWRIGRNGSKVGGTASFSIHAAIADDVKALFTEIYNDPERFPIKDIGGYSWRGDSATGEHNCGTAIDINANENYQVRDGKALVGSLWSPGVNPYSIPENGSVVRIFAAHGWSWGGNAWAEDSDQTTGYHDYMHFSYMGR